MTDYNFGRIVTGGDIETAIVDTLNLWLPTYMRAIERRHALAGSRPVVRAVVVASEVTNWPEEQTPAVIVALGVSNQIGKDTAETPTPAGQIGQDYWARYDLIVASLVQGQTEQVRDLAAFYGRAISMCLIHKATEHDVIDDLDWIREEPTSAAADPQYRRSTASYAEHFDLLARGVMTDNSGPAGPPIQAPPIDPTTPYPDDPVVVEDHEDVIPIELDKEL